MTTKKKQADAKRLERAQEIADIIKQGGFAPVPEGAVFQNSWPQRPVVKKDLKALKQLFEGDDE